MRTRLLWLCVLLLTTQVGVPALAGAAEGRQEAAISLDPPFERVGGDSLKARLAVKYDGAGVGVGLRGFHIVIDFDDTYVFVDDADVDDAEPDVEVTVAESAGLPAQPARGRARTSGSPTRAARS